jgi:hypothetical protein
MAYFFLNHGHLLPWNIFIKLRFWSHFPVAVKKIRMYNKTVNTGKGKIIQECTKNGRTEYSFCASHNSISE